MSDSPGTAIELRGIVTKVFYAAPHFSAGRLRPAGKGVEVPFAGKCFVRPGDTVAFRGAWVDNEKFGRQFQVDSVAYEEELDTDGLATWLATHGDAVGIGSVKANRIATEYGKDFGRILKEDPGQLAIFAQVPIENVMQLADAWLAREEFNRLATKLTALKLSRHEVELLAQEFGPSVLTILEQDPFMVLGRIDGIGFVRIDDIATRLGFPKTNPKRIAAGVVHALRQQTAEGSTCDSRDHLLGEAEELLTLDALNGREQIKQALDKLAESGSLRLVGNRYAIPWMVKCESLIADLLLNGNGPNQQCPADRLDAIVEEYCKPLGDDSQERAVAQALKHRVSVITGPAGSGKTTVVRALVNIYHDALAKTYDDPLRPAFEVPIRIGRNIALCAPTGKAARRLTEVTGYPASTIHRLLEYHPKLGFQRNADNPLSVDVLIVDEISMVDVELAYFLFRALRPETAVVLVGDHHQLPPVGPGAVLRDCVEKRLAPITVLEKCHRQAGTLKEKCNQVLAGVVEPTVPKEGPYSPWIAFDALETNEQVLAAVEKVFRESATRWGFKVPWDVQFMTPIHRGPVGTQAINTLLQRLHQELLGVNVDPTSPDQRARLYVNDKVICTRNNYNLDIMNGHQGQVIQLDPLTVNFEGRNVVIPKDCKGDIDLAYCLTPHKMQGSEVPLAVTICHRSHGWMLHRNWLYTAVTRAKKMNILLGDQTGVRRAAERVVLNERKTLLSVLACNSKDGSAE